MTAVLAEPAQDEWPEGVLFRPTWSIGYQVDFSARIFCMGSALLAADLGTGKSLMALGVAGLSLEEQAIDGVLVVCEPNKLREWLDDFGRFTRIPAAIYHGPRRKKLLDDPPAALITTYETARDDVAIFPPKKSRSKMLQPGPLMDFMRGRRWLIVYDECTKLGRRTSNLYKAHFWMTQQLRKDDPELRVVGMSATPMDTDFENVFNEMRIVVPKAMPLVKEFEEQCIKDRDIYNRPIYREEGKAWFRERCEPWILRKRKTDQDVRDHFPPLVEEFRRIEMKPDQFRLYQTLEDLAWDPETKERQDVPGLAPLLRQLAGDPWAVLEAAKTGDSELAKMVAEVMGEELQKCSSAKAAELITLADLVMSSGGKLVVFTFFAHTVLTAVRKRLGDRTVYTYHGGQTGAENEHQKALFKAHCGGAILLASDAGSKGINLPEASYIVEYEPARTYATRQQRAGRGHRLGKQDPLTVITFVLEDSIERSRSIPSLLARNKDQDFILGDTDAEGHMTMEERRALFAQARPRRGT